MTSECPPTIPSVGDVNNNYNNNNNNKNLIKTLAMTGPMTTEEMKMFKWTLNNHFIETLTFDGGWADDGTEDVIRCVMSTDTPTLTTFQTPIFKIKGQKMVINKGRRFLTRDANLINDLLIKFKVINLIQVDAVYDAIDINIIIGVCDKIERLDAGRSIKICFSQKSKIFIDNNNN